MPPNTRVTGAEYDPPQYRGCSGGTPEQVYDLAARDGVPTEWQYPWVSGHGDDSFTCHYNNTRVATPAVLKIDGYHMCEKNNMASVMHAVATVGPLSIGVAADDFWSSCASRTRVHADHSTRARNSQIYHSFALHATDTAFLPPCAHGADKGGILTTDFNSSATASEVVMDHAVVLMGYGYE